MRSSGTPAARAASYEQSSERRALVDVDVGAHALRCTGSTTMRLSARRCGSPRRCTRSRDHACGLPRRDRGEARPQLADARAGARRRSWPDACAERGLEQRVHLRRRDRAVRHLVLARAGRGRRRSPSGTAGRRPGPVEPGLRVDRAGPASGCACTRRRRPATTSRSPAGIAAPSSFTSSCGLLPPTVVSIVVRGLDAEPAGEERARVGVAPRHDLGDRDGVDARARRAGVGERGAAPRRRAGRPARARAPGRRCAGAPGRHRR